MKRSYKLFKICLWKSQHIFFAKSLCYVKLPDISSKNANSLVCFWTALKNKRDLEITSTYEHSHTEATQNRQRKHNTGSNCGEQKTNKTQFNPVRPSFWRRKRENWIYYRLCLSDVLFSHEGENSGIQSVRRRIR